MRYDINNRCKDMHAYTVGPGYVTSGTAYVSLQG